MLAILPILCFVLLFDTLWRRQRDPDPRPAFVAAAIVWGTLLAAITELLSLGRLLTLPTVAAMWAAACGAAALFAVRSKAPARPLSGLLPHRLSRLELPLLAPVLLICLVTAVIAAIGWPNNTDSMIYHLPRALHWIQNASVELYPTHVSRQVASPPLAEYALMLFMLLGGDDRLTNFVQWFSMSGSVVGVSLIARQLGAGRPGQLFSALFCATIPMGIMQASSTQNDYVPTFWLVCMVSSLLVWRAEPGSARGPLLTGASFGLAVLTKSTGAMFGAPIAAVLLLPFVRRISLTGLRQWMLAGLVAIALNAPVTIRTVDAFGWGDVIPSGVSLRKRASPTQGLLNLIHTPQAIASNLVRNTALHLGTPFPAVNRAIQGAIVAWHGWLGIDASDPRTTWQAPEFSFEIPPAIPHENMAGNPLHLLLVVVTAAPLALSRWGRRVVPIWSYALSLALGYFLFCSVVMWQVFHSRLHLALFVLWAPVAALMLERSRKLLALAAIPLVVVSWPFLFGNLVHPLVGEDSIIGMGRIDQMFLRTPYKAPGFVGAANVVRSAGCTQVGLLVDWKFWEYPLWVLLPEIRAGRGRLEHVESLNRSGPLASRWPEFVPCAVIAADDDRAGETVQVGGRTFPRVWQGAGFMVYLAPS